MNLCREAAFREGLSDPEFWEHVLLGGKAPGPDYDIDLDDIEQMKGSPARNADRQARAPMTLRADR